MSFKNWVIYHMPRKPLCSIVQNTRQLVLIFCATTKQKFPPPKKTLSLSVIELWFLTQKANALSATLLLHQRECLLSNLVSGKTGRSAESLVALSRRSTPAVCMQSLRLSAQFYEADFQPTVSNGSKTHLTKIWPQRLSVEGTGLVVQYKIFMMSETHPPSPPSPVTVFGRLYISQDNSYSGLGRFKDKCRSAYATCLSCFFACFGLRKNSECKLVPHWSMHRPTCPG